MRRRLLVALMVFIVLVAALLVGCRLYFRLPVSDYYAASERAFCFAGLSDGFIPQALDYVPEENVFLLSGYMQDGSSSPVYIIDRKDGTLRKKALLSVCDDHTGGLACHGNLFYITDDENDCLWVYSLTELLACENGALLQPVGEVKLSTENDHIDPAFVTACDDGLIVGEFYRAGNYETLPSHASADGARHAIAV